MQPHPEGGWFAEHYRAAETKPTPRGERNWCTGIYYLLEAGNFSRFHRLLQADEMWHTYDGSGTTELHVHMIHPEGHHELLRLGTGPNARPSGVVPAGSWFAAELAPGCDWFLAGCTVSPGFDFADFEIAERGALRDAYPQHATFIERLTHP